MKIKHILSTVAAMVMISSFGSGYARSMAPAPSIPPFQYFQNIARTAGESESEIVVYMSKEFTQYSMLGSSTQVFVDNQKRMQLNGGEYGTAVVPNGTHSIYVEAYGFRSNVLTVEAAENRIVFWPKIKGGHIVFTQFLDLIKYADISLKGFTAPPKPSLDNPKKPPPKPIIALSGKDLPKIAVYVTGNAADGEKKALGTRMLASLVNSGRYIAIERSNSFLAEIEKEHITQRSGAVDDSQISELGKQFGVKFVCIAAITPAFGEFQVSARIVDVETAQVIFIGESASPLKSMADLARVSDQIVESMFGRDGGK